MRASVKRTAVVRSFAGFRPSEQNDPVSRAKLGDIKQALEARD